MQDDFDKFIQDIFVELENEKPQRAFHYNDGGRSKYFKGNAADCGPRAMAIALQLDYKQCYDELADENKKAGGKRTAREGLYRSVYETVLYRHGWTWHKAPVIEGRKAKYFDMPQGRVIVRMARHYSAVINGVVHDTWDCREKMVYGYWKK